jgi:hypothetical protein
MNLQIYGWAFEREFMKATEQFYKEESHEKVQQLDVSTVGIRTESENLRISRPAYICNLRKNV